MAAAAIEVIAPYLVVKDKQAQLAIATHHIMSIGKGYRLSKDQISKIEANTLLFRVMNQRGTVSGLRDPVSQV